MGLIVFSSRSGIFTITNTSSHPWHQSHLSLIFTNTGTNTKTSGMHEIFPGMFSSHVMMHGTGLNRKICVRVSCWHKMWWYLLSSFLVASSVAQIENQYLSKMNTLDARQNYHDRYLPNSIDRLGGEVGPHILANPSYCPGGTTSTNDDKCYWDGGLATSWNLCETRCGGMGRKMICIDSAATLSFVVSTFSAYPIFWIGLNDIATEGTFVWSGGCISSFRQWRVNEPKTGIEGTEENCIASLSGEFIDAPCSTQAFCVCESSLRPTSQPSSQPSAQPSRQPTRQPSSQPSRQPSAQPTRQPTCQPTHQPISYPSTLPTSQPSNSPSAQPFCKPSSLPSTQPSAQPTCIPTTQPSILPSSQPTGQPSTQPSEQPSCRPTSQPSSQPTDCPSAQPSNQPSANPSIKPTSQPSQQPSVLPSVQPSSRPSVQPTDQPFAQPSEQPSVQPSGRPTSLPSMQPSTQPSPKPSSRPSSRPSVKPSEQPSTRPSTQPTAQPSTQPSTQPSSEPSSQPSDHPSAEPSTDPSACPTTQPSTQPTSWPSGQPSKEPSGAPSGQPSSHPTDQPTAQPSQQPQGKPSSQPTGAPSEKPTNEWFVALSHSVSQYESLSSVGESLWTCSGTGQCDVIDTATGTYQTRYTFMNMIYGVIRADTIGRTIINGRINKLGEVFSEIMSCSLHGQESLPCDALSFADTLFTAVSYVPYSDKIVYVGHYNQLASTTILNVKDYSTNNYVFSFRNVKAIVLSHIQSPPNFVGSFIAGTGVQSVGSSTNYIIFGRLRVDNGALIAMALTPTRGNILNSAELVNAMALEYVNPDSFIAGGLKLNDGAGMHAYLIRVNGWFGTILYCMRYRVRPENGRRALQSSVPVSTGAVTGVAVVDNVMFLVARIHRTATFNRTATSVVLLKANAVTGAIVMQVSIAASNGSFTCSHITMSGDYLTLLCSLQSSAKDTDSMSVLLSIDSELSIKKLPSALVLTYDDLLETESIPFTSRNVPVMTAKTEVSMSRYTYIPGQQKSTHQPTLAPTKVPSQLPSWIPSAQPSSSPSAGPSISPQPTSHPSSSGPTNTYKPTVKPTQRPSAAPSKAPTCSPTISPSIIPTASPSVLPSTRPSSLSSTAVTSIPTLDPTEIPTRAPTVQATRAPSRTPSSKQTSTPSARPTLTSADTANLGLPGGQLTNIIVGCVAGMITFIWCAYHFYRVIQYCKYIAYKDKRRVLFLQASDTPAKLKHPILQRIVSCVTTTKIPAPDLEIRSKVVVANNIHQNDVLAGTAEPAMDLYQGRGAYMVSPAGFVDLEANTQGGSKRQRGEVLRPEDEVDKITAVPSMKQTVSQNNAEEHTRNSLMSEISDSQSDYGDESHSERSSSSSECASSEESYFSSDRSNVVYSLSSGKESDLNGSRDESDGEYRSSCSDNDSHSNDELQQQRV